VGALLRILGPTLASAAHLPAATSESRAPAPRRKEFANRTKEIEMSEREKFIRGALESRVPFFLNSNICTKSFEHSILKKTDVQHLQMYM